MKTLKGVANTLFVPLYARIAVSKEYPEFFYDEKALEMEEYIPVEVKNGASQYSHMASVSRYYNMDQMTKAFIEKHDKSNLVFLGAGLETAYYRLIKDYAHKDVQYYEVDLEEVMETRYSLLGKGEKETLLGGDLFTMEWSKALDVSLPTLIVASGVFQYFQEERILSFIQQLKIKFPKGELIFDATNKKGLEFANKFIEKSGNTEARMYFYVENSQAFAKKTGTTLLEERVFFKDARKLGRKLKLMTRIFMAVVDRKKRTIIVHLLLK